MEEINVLLVEANAELLWRIEAFLSVKEGIRIIGKASNGIDSLKIITKKKVDLVITGIMMPLMDGFTMLEEIQRKCINPMPKIIVVSSLGREDYIRRALDLGVIRYFVKPADPKTILNYIYDLFDFGNKLTC